MSEYEAGVRGTPEDMRRFRKKANTAIVPAEKPKQIDYVRQEALRPPTIQEYIEKHKNLRHFIRRNLKAGIDYDQIPGTNGKTLLQPGAEKIAVWLKVKPMFDKVETDQGNGHIEVVVRCHLLPLLVFDLVMGLIERGTSDVDKAVAAIIRASELSNAEASCSTMETNFRYRWADMRDEEGNPIKPDKRQAAKLSAINMGRWIPAKMVGAKIVAMTPKDKKAKVPVAYWIWQERVDNPNIHDEKNKVRQMGEKRAFVKGIKRMGALSEVFQEDPNEWPETLDVKTEKPEEEAFKPGQIQHDFDEDAPHGHRPGSEKAKQAEASLRRVEEADAQLNGKGSIITVQWREKELALIVGAPPAAANDIRHTFMGVKLEGKEEYVVTAAYVPSLCEHFTKLGFKIQEIQPASKTKEAPKDAVEESAIVKQCRQSTGNKTPNLQVLFGNFWIYCYDKKLWEPLYKAIGKEVRALVLRKEGKPPVICGLLNAGGIPFEGDGRTVAAG